MVLGKRLAGEQCACDHVNEKGEVYRLAPSKKDQIRALRELEAPLFPGERTPIQRMMETEWPSRISLPKPGWGAGGVGGLLQTL